MPADVESMAYTGQVPWHRLGEKVEGLDPQEMLKAAGLDWEVKTVPMLAKAGDTADDLIILPDHRALVRNRNGDLDTLGVCGPKYIPTQNHQAFEFFEKFTKAGHMTMETAGALQSGKQVFGLAKLSKGFTLPGRDRVEGYLLLSHPHIWGKSLQLMYTPIRVVCMNTLMMALQQAGDNKFSMPHIQEFTVDIQRKAEEVLGLGELRTKEFETKAKLLASKSFTEESVNMYVAALFDKAQLEADKIEAQTFNRTAWQVRNLIEKSPGSTLKAANGTWWGALNGVTYFVDHVAGRERDTALTSAWFGARANKKRQALELALEMSQAA